ncbi:hypothetical protein M0R04_05745 [Candidatus Dojkabacteria bacterium]|jgi:hypothetical protein|nr:hypothetical protein [Candidatus Dojkabacteria bacterium]
MSKEVNRGRFEEDISKSPEMVKEEVTVEDNTTAEGVTKGVQTVFLSGIGTIIYELPGVELTLQGERLQAEFKGEQLRKGKLLTIAQLRAIYKQPVMIEQDGKQVVVSKGAWTDEDETKLESLPDEIREKDKLFEDYREKIHDLTIQKEDLGSNKKKEARKLELENIINRESEQAFLVWKELANLKLDYLDLQSKKIVLFGESLEEQANLEKVKLYAPVCVKVKKGDTISPYWKNMGDLLSSDYTSLRILSLFNMVLRGVDVSFFGDTLVDQKT